MLSLISWMRFVRLRRCPSSSVSSLPGSSVEIFLQINQHCQQVDVERINYLRTCDHNNLRQVGITFPVNFFDGRIRVTSRHFGHETKYIAILLNVAFGLFLSSVVQVM